MDKERFEKQLAFMEKHNAAFSFTGYEFADENAVDEIASELEKENAKLNELDNMSFKCANVFDLLTELYEKYAVKKNYGKNKSHVWRNISQKACEKNNTYCKCLHDCIC
mgnify:CR=1 FL=1